MLKCSKCGKVKSSSEFYVRPNRKRGYSSSCKQCTREARRAKKSANNEYMKLWRADNKDKVREQNRKQYKKNAEKYKAYQRQYRKDNAAYLKEYHAKYTQENMGKRLARNAKRRASQLQATPRWLTPAQLKQMQALYDACPSGYHVDHIIPLQGKNVCGLHVPWNLQILPAEQNLKKGNKTDQSHRGIVSTYKCSPSSISSMPSRGATGR